MVSGSENRRKTKSTVVDIAREDDTRCPRTSPETLAKSPTAALFKICRSNSKFFIACSSVMGFFRGIV